MSDPDTLGESAAAALVHARVSKARYGHPMRGHTEILEVHRCIIFDFCAIITNFLSQSMQRCAAWIVRSTGIKTKKLSELMLAGYGRGRRGGARAEWCRLCSAVVRFSLGTAVEGTEGREAGMINLAPGVTLGSLLLFQIPDGFRTGSISSSDRVSRDVDERNVPASLSNGSDDDSDDQEASEESGDGVDEVKSGKRTKEKVSLELRGLGVKDGRAARQLASNDARPSRHGKRQKRANA